MRLARFSLLIVLLIFGSVDVFSQSEKNMTLAQRHYSSRNYDDAILYYERALKEVGRDFFIHLRLAECYTYLQNGKAAVIMRT